MSFRQMINYGTFPDGGVAAPPVMAGSPMVPINGAEFMPSYSGVGGAMPGMPGVGGTGGGLFAGMSGLDKVQTGIAGLQTLGSLWMGFKAAKMANKNFKFQKDITNTNLANQIKSYNTALSDRARSRGVMEGQSPDQINQYVADNSLNRTQSRPSGYNNNYRDSTAANPGQTTRPTASSISAYSAVAQGLGERSVRDRDTI